MAAAPKVSVVSAFFNRAWALDETIACLVGQTLREIEILLIDDGSTDGTAARLRAIADLRVRALIGPNLGFTRAMNRAIGQARGDYVAIHGSGDLSHPARLERQAAFLDANPSVGVVGCRVREPNRDVGPVHAVERGPMLPVLLRRNPFAHGDVMFRRTLFNQVGGYRELFRYAQDYDLWLRIGRLCDYAVLPDLLYERRFPPDGVSRDPRRLYLQRKLAEAARQAAAASDPDGCDWIDRHGPAGLLLARPSRALAHKLTDEGLRWLRDDRRDSANFLLDAALIEFRDLRSRAGWLAGRVACWPAMRPVLRLLLRRLSPPPVVRV